ncbi:hypothetical protein MCEMSEM23_01470 [Rhabdaerophilaceae bacterium]
MIKSKIMRQVLRAIYWRLRSLPLIGPLVERLRNRLRPGARADMHWTLHHLSENSRTHGLAISGLRDAVTRALHTLQSIPREIDKRVYDSAHTANLKMDAQAADLKAQMDAHGLAISGLRDAVTRALHTLQSIPREIDKRVYDSAHAANLKMDAQAADTHARMDAQAADMHARMNAHATEAQSRYADLESRLFAELYKLTDYQNQKFDKHASELTTNLFGRLEFTRTEAMLELRRLTRADIAGPSAGQAVLVRVIDQIKLDAQKNAGAIRLNLGCGHIPVEGYLNVDMRELPGVDIVAPVTSLPFAAGEVEEIYGAHIAEHFPEHVFLNQVLPYWRDKLKPGGRLRLELPNGEAMVRAFQAGEVDFATLALIIMGGQEYEGDFHYAFYSPESMSKLLTAAGFTAIEVVDAARRNGLCLEMEIRAVRS